MHLPKLNQLSLTSQLSLLGVIVLLVGVFFSVNNTLNRQQSQSNASGVPQSASASCDASGNAVVNVSFTNTQTDTSVGMHVKAQDIQTGALTDLGVIPAGDTKTGMINTHSSSLNSSGVIFFFNSTNGQESIGQRSASYAGVHC